jgi:uncharacterized protein YegP (UPF0339 family)
MINSALNRLHHDAAVTPRRGTRSKGELKYEVFESKGQYYWRAKSKNGNIIADGNEGYKAKASCENGMESFQRQAPDAPVVEV